MVKSTQSALDKATGEKTGRAEDLSATKQHRADFSTVLHSLNVPDNVVERLTHEGIASFMDIRRQGGNLPNIDGLSPELGEKLASHARLAAISANLDVNTKLVEGGVRGVIDLANARLGEPAERTGVDPAEVQVLQQRAKLIKADMHARFVDTAIASAPANRGYWLYAYAEPETGMARVAATATAATDPDACDICQDCKSVLSPAAYLVDLVNFVMECFSSTFPDLDTLDKRFYRSFNNCQIGCEEVNKKIRQIDIANEILQKFVIDNRPGLTRELLYAEFLSEIAHYLKPKILEKTFDAYLGEMGTTREEIQEAFDAASASPPNRTRLDGLLNRLGLSEEELKKLDRRDPAHITISDIDAFPELVHKVKAKGLSPDKIEDLVAYQDALTQAEAAIDRVKEYTLPDVRSNLIHAACKFTASNKKSVIVVTTDGRLAQIWDTDRWNIDFPVELAGHPDLRFQGNPSVWGRDVAANKKSIFVLTADGRLAQIWDTDRWNIDFPMELAGQPDLRFQGNPSVWGRDVAANKKSIFVLTADGRLAQIWDTDRWNIDFPVELAGQPDLRFQGNPSVWGRDVAANKKSIFALTADGRLAQIWDTDRWNIDFPMELAGQPDLRFQGNPSVWGRDEVSNKKSIFALTSDGRLAQIWETGQWSINFPVELAGQPDLRFQGNPSVWGRDVAANKKSIFALTADGRLAQIWDTNRWNIAFPVELAGQPNLRFQRNPSVWGRDVAANKKSIFTLTSDGRLAQIWDTDRWNIDFPVELAGQPDLRFQGNPSPWGRYEPFNSAKELGNYLHIDLSVDACAVTTRVANAIDALQSFFLAFQLGREKQLWPGQKVDLVIPRTNFDARWRWLQSYSLWHAAMMVYLYPENFLLPSVRKNQTPQFRLFLDAMRTDTVGVDTIRDALLNFERTITTELSWLQLGFVATLRGRTFLFSARNLNYPTTGAVYCTEIEPDGTWNGWLKLKLPGERMIGAVGFNDCIYLFFSPDNAGSNTVKGFQYAWINPNDIHSSANEKAPTLESSPDIGPFVNPLKEPVAIVAGSDSITIWFRWEKDKSRLSNAFMDSFHRWGTKSLIPQHRLFDSTFPLRAVGHIGDSDYLLFGATPDDGTTGHLYVVGIKDPTSEPVLRDVWDFQRDFVSSLRYYAGTVQGDRLVIAENVGTGELLTTQPTIASFSPNTPASQVTWLQSTSSIQYSPLVAISLIGEDLLLIDSAHYDVCKLAEANVVMLATGSTYMGYLSRASLFRYPIESTPDELATFKSKQNQVYSPTTLRDFGRLFLDEWYFFTPLVIAKMLQEARHFEEAANWFHVLFYPYQVTPQERLIYYGFNVISSGGDPKNTIAWLRDPFNPFLIATRRQGAFLRHTIYQYVENLLDWADAEFTRDTNESINRARELYELAEDILELDAIPQDRCGAAWRDLLAKIYETQNAEQVRILLLLLEPLKTLTGRVKFSDFDEIRKRLHETDDDMRLAKVKEYVDQIKARPVSTQTLEQISLQLREREKLELDWEAVYDDTNASLRVGNLYPTFYLADASNSLLSPEVGIVQSLALKLNCGFCVPFNPILDILRWRIESNLEKIRTCSNFAGMRRALRPYAAAADPTAAVQQVAAGEDTEAAIPDEPPPIHRFSYLIERARYYVQVAQQMEGLFLMALEKKDAEEYSLLKAKQDLKSANANTTLQVLRVQEAADGVELANRQKIRAEFQRDHFADLIEKGELPYEVEAVKNVWTAHDNMIWATSLGGLNTLIQAALAPNLLAAIGFLSAGIPQAVQGASSVMSLASQARLMQANFQRRLQEWGLQKGLAERDIKISEQGVTISNDRLAITEKERDISQLHSEFAAEIVTFLGAKFTNKDLYAWMSRVTRQYYRTHLNFATVIGRMAQQALAFERQEPITIVASYYAEAEKKDLLVAERLLTDINKLDQHRLLTEKRRKELTKVVSLASMAPVEFQQLRESGRMTFETSLSQFDRDFPGHYMRLIKNVSMTMVALIPPTEAIHASLSNHGLSRVMVGPPFDEPRVIQRQPESIAVSVASNGTGLFDLRLDDPILLPFESSGVETVWELEMPKAANRFDYETLIDMFFTIRYTALDDPSYRNKVIKQLGDSVSSSASFSMRNGFPDAWYDFNNPTFLADPTEYGYEEGKVRPPYTLQFELGQRDFPPNETLDKIMRLNLVLSQSKPTKMPVEIEFKPTFVFNVSLDFLGELTAGTFSEQLRKEFTNHGIHLSQVATIQTLEADKRWQISDGIKRYIVERAEQSLSIYGSPMEYVVEADFDWNPKLKDPDKGPIRLTAFTHFRTVPNSDWERAQQPIAINTLKPATGRWRLRINNRLRKIDRQEFSASDYPGLFDAAVVDAQNKLNLDDLKDALFVTTYEAKVSW